MDDSPLTETNCVIIPYKAMLSCDYSLASDLECLVTLKFTIVHLEAVYFSQEITKKIFCLLSSSRKVYTCYTCMHTQDFLSVIFIQKGIYMLRMYAHTSVYAYMGKKKPFTR